MNHLIKSLLAVILYLIPFVSKAQESKPEYSKVSFSIRGKYFLIPGWEDRFWRDYSYGGEVFIGKHHAIGMDGAVFRTRIDYDDMNDVGLYSDITRRSYVYIDYKYIYPFNRGFSLYAQLYSKLFGRRMGWSEKTDYEYKEPKDLTYLDRTARGKFKDFGLGIGCKWYFNGGNSGLDFSVNAYRRFGSFLETRYSGSTGWVTNHIDESSRVFGCIRLTFFYHFLRFEKSNNPVDRLKTW